MNEELFNELMGWVEKRRHSIPSEIDFSQLVAQEDEIKPLMARCAELEAKVAALEAENSTLRGHIEQLREAVEEGLSTYKVPMTARICEALAELAATDPPIGADRRPG